MQNKLPRIDELRLLKKQALANAARQRRRQNKMLDVKVRPDFWEQVARDYEREIQELEKQ